MRDDMQELSIERLKETELDIFIEIDRFCRKHEIRYSLAEERCLARYGTRALSRGMMILI